LTSTSCDINQIGTTSNLLQNQNGCDSLVILTTTLLASDATYLVAESCNPSDVGVTNQVLANQNGCDSLVVLTTTLIQNSMDTTYLAITTCDSSEVGVFITILPNQNGCDSVVVEIVEYMGMPALEVGDVVVCEGEEVELWVTGGDGNYVWYGDDLSCVNCPNPMVRPATTTTFRVSSTSCAGMEMKEMTVTVVPNPMITAGQDDEVINLGDSVRLWATTNQVLSNLNWFTADDQIICANCTEVMVTPKVTTIYSVTATNDLGCEVSKPLRVIVNQTCPDAKVEAPNLMTPNNDGVNDVFDIRYTGLQNIAVLRIYNRWGQKVFETTNLDVKWDGTFRGQSVDPGVFVYYFEATCPNGDQKIYKGNVTLVR
jgi:gliding motility-associated-like protein